MYPLEAALKNGGSRDQPTTATLSIMPSKEEDDAVFRCEVWNRALPEDKKMISTVSLSVNCKLFNLSSFRFNYLGFRRCKVHLTIHVILIVVL